MVISGFQLFQVASLVVTFGPNMTSEAISEHLILLFFWNGIYKHRSRQYVPKALIYYTIVSQKSAHPLLLSQFPVFDLHPGASFAWIIRAHLWSAEKHSMKCYAYLRQEIFAVHFTERWLCIVVG